MRTTWKVAVVPPRTNDGANWQMRILPPPGAKDETGAPLREMRRSTETTDHAKALEQAKQIEKDLNEAFGAQERTFLSVYNAHLDYRRRDGETAATTLDHYEAVRATCLAFLSLPVSEIDRAAVLTFRDALQGTLANPTINRYMNALSASWTWGLERGLVAREWPRVRCLRAKPTKKRPLSPDECQQILEWVTAKYDGAWLPLFTFVYETGVRVSEACGIDQIDVNRDTGAVLIRGTKTEGSWRTVFVSPECLALLPEREGAVFRAFRRPTERATRHAVKNVMRRALRALELPAGKVDFHSFRRSWIKDAERTEVPRAVAMKATGHVNESVYVGYQRNAEDDLEAIRTVTEKVREKREAALNPVGASEVETEPDQPCPHGSEPSGPNSCREQARSPNDPPGSCAETSGDGPATTVRKVWAEFEVAETLNSVANLGKSFRAALRQVCTDPALRAALERALDDGWPDETPSTLMTDTGVRPGSNPAPRPEVG